MTIIFLFFNMLKTNKIAPKYIKYIAIYTLKEESNAEELSRVDTFAKFRELTFANLRFFRE